MTENSRKKVCILGAGAMGCLYGGLLAENPSLDVCLVARNEEKAAFLEKQGILLTEGNCQRRIPVRCIASGKCTFTPDYVIVLVKAHETQASFHGNRALFTDRTFVLTLQNGLGGAQFLQEKISPGLFAAGISRHNSTLLGAGKILHGGSGLTLAGAFSPEGKECVEAFLELFRSSGIAAEESTDISRTLWEKLLVNLALNPLTMLYQVKNGQIAEEESLRREAALLVREALTVARAEGISPGTDEEVLAHVFQVAHSTAQGTSSMLQDFLRKKKTEVDAINGAVIALAEKHHLAVPCNRRIVSQVHEAEKNF